MVRKRVMLLAVLLPFLLQGLGLALAAHLAVDGEHHGSHDGRSAPCPICFNVIHGQHSVIPITSDHAILTQESNEPFVYVVADGFTVSIHLGLSQRGPPTMI